MALDAAGRRALRTRLLVGPTLILAIVGVYILDRRVTNGTASAALLLLMGIGGLLEYVAMMRGAGFPVGRSFLVGAGTLLLSMPFFFDSWGQLDSELYPAVLLTLGLVFVMSCRALARSRMEKGLEEAGSTVLGFVLFAWPIFLAQGLALRFLPALLFVVLVAKGGDIFGYFAGISFGRRKLIPHVSPGKSIEGAIGSLVGSCALSALLCGPLLSKELTLGVPAALGIGVMINLTTQLGDLVESLLKRRCGVKDSSTLLPVHGGVLDLIDSLLFSVPAFFFVYIRLT